MVIDVLAGSGRGRLLTRGTVTVVHIGFNI